MLVLLGSGIVFAQEQNAPAAQPGQSLQASANLPRTFSSSHEFQVYDPAEPVVETSVNGAFLNHDITIHVNMSSHDGVAKLTGSYSVVVDIWNDTKGAYVPLQTLTSGKVITLASTPTTLSFGFKPTTPAQYNVDVEFTAQSYTLA